MMNMPEIERLEEAVDATSLGVWDWDYARDEVYCNDIYLTMLGYEPGEIIVDHQFWIDHLHDEDRDSTLQALHAYLHGKSDKYEVDCRLKTKSGTFKWVRCRGKIYERLPDGSPKRMVGVHRDIHHDVMVREELSALVMHNQQLVDRLEMAIEGGDLAIWDWNLGSETVDTNDAWLTLLDYTPGDFVPSFEIWKQLMHPDDLPKANDLLEDHLAGRSALFEAKVRMKTANGGWRWILCKGKVSERDAEGNPLRCVGIHRDIDSEVVLADKLRQERNEATEASAAKSNFLANMSHELRTPMSGVLGMLDLLEGANLTEQQEAYLGYCKTSARNLLSLVDELLDFARMESGRATVDYGDVNVEQIIDTVIASRRSVVSELPITLNARIDLPQEMMLRTDERKVFQIVSNLVDNAIKFTEAGHVDVTAFCEELGGNKSMLTIDVSDTGVGISETDLGRIFNRFEQVDNTSERKHQGAGLGLAISRRIAELLGGELRVSSEEGRGSTFSLCIPCERAEQQPEASSLAGPAPSLEPDDTQTVHVLVAEDNEINQRLLEAILENAGFEVTIVVDGEAAVEKAVTGQFDVVLMDMHMPKLDGVGATNQIRRCLDLADLPIIAVTADALLGTRERLLGEGLSDYISKPFDAKELVNKVRRYAQSPTMTDVIGLDTKTASGA